MGLKLCYGVYYDIDDWRKAVALPSHNVFSKTCTLCSSANPSTNNFCGNCGSDIRHVNTELTTEEIIDITQRTAGPPPVPIVVNADSERIYICQLLDKTSTNFAKFVRQPRLMRWEAIGDAIASYVKKLGLPKVDAHLFAFADEKPKETKE